MTMEKTCREQVTEPLELTTRGHASVAATDSEVNASKGRLLFPLDFMYERAGVELPSAEPLESSQMPFPYRALLVHNRSMTLRLQHYYGEPLLLRILAVFADRSWYYRRILLVRQFSGQPVEMGAIRLRLGAFTPSVQTQIRDKAVPLGPLLRANGVEFESRPKEFLSIQPNGEMMGVFWMARPYRLFGRHTELFHRAVKVGDIIEVLPPTGASSSDSAAADDRERRVDRATAGTVRR